MNFIKFVLLIIVLTANQLFAQENNTIFVGYIPIEGFIDEVSPNYLWYHKTAIIIENNNVTINQNPISIYKKDTLHSSSDGGFYNYSGTVEYLANNQLKFSLKQENCDYCPVPVAMKKDKKGNLTPKPQKTIYWYGFKKRNEIIINKISFKKVE